MPSRPISKPLRQFICIIFIGLMLTACGGGDDHKPPQELDCTLPCLSASPALDVTSISSATGGTVKISFQIQGDLSNVSVVVISLLSVDLKSGVIGFAYVQPTKADNTLSIDVAAGSDTGSYYPNIAISAVSPTNSGSQFYIDPTRSATQYTYAEVTSGTLSKQEITPYNVPVLSVTP